MIPATAGGVCAFLSQGADGTVGGTRPWQGNWTAENRAAEAQIMRDNMADERVAIAEIQGALELLRAH